VDERVADERTLSRDRGGRFDGNEKLRLGTRVCGVLHDDVTRLAG
jgi:hypothetical protein